MPCLGVCVGSGVTLGVLPGAHVVHEAGSKDTVQAWGLLASWGLGLVSVALFRLRVHPTIPLPRKQLGIWGRVCLPTPFLYLRICFCLLS